MLKLPISLAMLLLLVASAQGQRATRPPTTDPWEVTELTNQPSVTLELAALTTMPGAVFEVRPVLLVRCHEGQLEVFLSTGSVLDSDDSVMTPVRIQWGTRPPEETRWSRSTDYRSASARDPRAFLGQLMSNPDLRVEVRPLNKSWQVIRFNARGLEGHMPKVDAACPPRAGGDGHDSIPVHVYPDQMVDELPEILPGPPLEYPPLLRRAGVQGRVTVRAVIDTLGRAEPASLRIFASSNPGFEQSARDYVLHAWFRPARVKGRAVRVLVRVPLDYRLE